MNLYRKLAYMLLLIFTINCNFVLASNDITIEMNNKIMVFEQTPFVDNGRVLVPLRKICEKLGANVIWEEPDTITIIRYPNNIKLKIGSLVALNNDKAVKLDAPPKIINGSTFVPLRFVAEGLGVNVNFDEQQNKVIIKYEVKHGNSNGNIIMKGDTAKDGDFIYTSAYYGDGLYKINTKTFEKEKLFPYCANNINIVDDWIYAMLYTNNGQFENKGLYKFKKDGTKLTHLTDLYLINISVVNNKIYGITFKDSRIYSMNLDGSELCMVSNYGFEDINVTDHYLYMRNDKIRRMDLDTGEFTVVADVNTDDFIVDGEWIYFCRHIYKGEMFKTLADGSGEIIPLFKGLYSFNISNGYVYFVKLSESGVYRATIDGENIEKISDENVRHFDIIDDYLYCSNYGDFKVTVIKNDGSFEKTILLNSTLE